MADVPSNEEIERIAEGVGIWPYDAQRDANIYTLMVQARPANKQGEAALSIAVEALTLFVNKNNGYGDPDANDLGVQGQFSDMNRKWKLLRSHMWEGKPWTHTESFEEVLFDLIGHILLTVERSRAGKMR